MGDRHRQPARQVITAASRVLQPITADQPRKYSWQEDAWAYRDTVGELRFAEMWLGNCFSRSRLVAARRPAPGEEPQPVDNGPAFDLVARLAGGVPGQAGLLRNFAPFLLVPGAGYLVGEPRGRADKFLVVDAEDVRAGRADDGERGWELREDDGTMGWRQLSSNTVVTKIFRPHPRRRWEPDSPTRAALTILRELVLLTQHVEAVATSRLAGAGVQAFPAEMTLPKGWEKFLDEYYDAITKPVKDRSLAAALAPFAVKMPGEMIKFFKDGYISYASTFDEKSIELREEAITRLGNAMDMPRQVLTGEKQNHWGDWQVEESGLKIHVEPGLELICEGLTTGYLLPGLSGVAEADRGAAADIEAAERDTPDGEWLIWYDTSDLRVRPDRSQAAGEAHERWAINDDAYRKELGLSDTDPVDLDDEKTVQRIWLSLLGGDLAAVALEKLGLATADELNVTKGAFGETEVSPAGEEESPPENVRGLPERAPGGEAPPDEAPPERAAAAVEVPDHPPAVTPAVAIVAALDGIVHRAMERAGRRALNKLPKPNGRNAVSVPAERLHTSVKLDSLLPMDKLFEDAWDRVPEVAERLNEDADALVATCDAYARTLVRTQTEHSWESLSRALGVCPCEEKVPA